MTGRSGHATAAPTAAGSPCPIAPPVSVSQSCLGAPAVFAGSSVPDVIASSETIAPSGRIAPTASATVSAVSGPVGGAGRLRRRQRRTRAVGAQRVRERVEGVHHVCGRRCKVVDLAAVGHEVALLARVREERHGCLGINQHQVLEPAQLDRRELRHVGDPLDVRQAGAALHTRGKRLGEQLGAGRGGDACGSEQTGFTQGSAAKQNRGPAAVTQSARDRLHRGGEIRLRRRRRDRRRQRLGSLGPRHVRRQDQRRHLSRRPLGGDNRLDSVAGQAGRACRGPDPARDVACDRLDVGLQRRVVLDVLGGVVADDVDERHLGAPGVVQVRETVAQARPEMQQGRRGSIRHPCVAVRGAGRDALEQAEHGAHLRHRIERGDEMHLRRAGVREARRDAATGECSDECLGAVGHAARDHRLIAEGVIHQWLIEKRTRTGSDARAAWSRARKTRR